MFNDYLIFGSIIAVGSIIALYLLWIFFLAVMNLKQAKDDNKLPSISLKLGIPVLLIGYGLDYLIQYTIAVIIFAELPKEPTVSERVKRLIATGKGRRKTIALWLRDNLLSPFDRSGGHG